MLKLHLQGSKNYAIQTQVCTRVTKESSEAELGLMPSLPLAQSPCLVIRFSLCPSLCLCLSLSRFPATGGVVLATVEEKQNGRGRQKIIMTDMEAKNCLAERREICYGKQQWQKLPPYLKMTESTIVDLG